MIIGISVISCSLIYSIMLFILYFSKQRIKNMENRIYSVLVVINVLGLVLELLCCYFTYANGHSVLESFMCVLCNKLFVVYMITWISIFTFYIFYISFSNREKIKKDLEKPQSKIKKIVFVLYAILAITTVFLPIDYIYDGTYVYSEGPAVNLAVLCAGIFVIFDILCFVLNRKFINPKQYIPLVILILLMIGVIAIRLMNPGIVLINSTFAFVTLLMYHTIENPDMQLIGELYENKKLIEKSNEDTSKFLFRITQDLKAPVKEIIETSSEMKSMKSKEDLIEASTHINNQGNQVDYLINRALNISTMDTSNIKIFENKYNVYNLFKEISYRAVEEIKEPVKFNYTIGGSIPQFLYGDAIKIKHLVSSLLKIANKFTEEGFINLDVNALTRYNICRLIITMEDTGRGVSIDRINDILSLTEDIKEEKEDKNTLNIFEVKKQVNLLGGSFMIRSEEGKGTTVNITIDQKIVETKDNEINKRLENYEQTLTNSKKILLIDDDEEELDQIKQMLEKAELDVTSSMYGKDAIEKVRSKQKYDLIILDDELSDINALNILEELKQIKNFKMPVVVMINNNKEGIKLHYLKDGFTDTISKSKLEVEIERIIKKV